MSKRMLCALLTAGTCISDGVIALPMVLAKVKKSYQAYYLQFIYGKLLSVSHLNRVKP